VINFQASGFPFTIMDVAELLRLHIRRRSPGYAYTDCPLCGDRRGKMCLNLTKDVWYSNCCGDHGGMLALYARVQRTSNSEAYREICDELLTGGFAPAYEVQRKESARKEAAQQSEQASAQTIHQTYSALLSMLTLTPAHLNHLRTKRGLTDEQIKQFGFKSTPPAYLCRAITAKLIKAGHTVEGVPGFFVDDAGKWTVRYFQRTAGIIVPYFGVDGLIQGLQTRLDVPIKGKDDPPDKQGTKYLWLASADKPKGVSSGSPVHFVGDPNARVVYVTEGALKANIAHVLMGRTFVATGGAGCTSQLGELFAFLSRNGTEEIIEAQDMDKYSNQGVGAGASKVYLLAKEHGMACRRLTWNPNYKGIDDWQLALRQKENQSKECDNMNFKERYLSGECTLDDLEDYVSRWHEGPDDGVDLHDYLGFTHDEYSALLQVDFTCKFEDMMEAQRRRQRFRVYQLILSDAKVVPYAFRDISYLHKAGYQQPPAADYQLVYDGEIICPMEQEEKTVLERIFSRCNDSFPEGYVGRSLSLSDVVELYGDDGRRYFYCDTSGFVPVKFSPILVKSGKTAAAVTQPAPAIDGERLKNEVDALSTVIHVSQVRISAQDGQDHEADLFVFLPKGGTQEGTVTFQGKTYDEAFQSLVNTVNQKLCRYTKRVRDMQILPKTGKRYEVCSQCGGTRLYYFEFRTDYAAPGQYDPVNEGTPTIKQQDVPYRVGGTYCMDCGSFCNTETRLGELSRPDVMKDDKG